MRTRYAIAIAGVLALLLYSGGSLLTGHRGADLFIFLICAPVLWCFWMYIAYSDSKRSIWKVVGLWGLIDLSVLSLISVSLSASAASAGPAGDDAALVIVYSPLIWPMMLASHFDFVSRTLIYLTSNLKTSDASLIVLFNWISFSLIAVVPSVLWIVGMRHLAVRRELKADG